jgi:putative transposase
VSNSLLPTGIRASPRRLGRHCPKRSCNGARSTSPGTCLPKPPGGSAAGSARRPRPSFEAPTPKDAKARLEALKAGLGTQVPEAMECLDTGFVAATHFFAFPRAHWKRLRSTNGLERLHGEVKRRIRSVGAFPDRASALRLITAVAIEVTDIWDDRRYLDMSLLYSTETRAA